MKAFNEDLMANTVSVCYWNKDDVCVYVAEGLDDPKHVAAFVEYCRLLELKYPEYADHSIGHLYKVISDFYKYMGNDAFIDVVYTEEYFANTKYTVYEKYIEKLESWENPSLIRIIAEQSMLELIDGIQPEEDRLGVDFIRENMNTNEVYEAEGLTL